MQRLRLPLKRRIEQCGRSKLPRQEGQNCADEGWKFWFTSALSRCLGRTFTYKVKDVINHKSFLETRNRAAMYAGALSSTTKSKRLCLCCGWQSPSLHGRPIARLGEGFRSRPCTAVCRPTLVQAPFASGLVQSQDGGPVRKRQRVDSEAETHVKKLRAWANELFADQPWFKRLSPEDRCSNVGILQDNGGPAAVNAIKAVLAGDDPLHFTLPLVEIKTRKIAGYVHAAHKPETRELNIAHLKVDEAFRGQGLGGLLIEAAEDVSQRLGWSCSSTTLSVLEVNAPACQCYWKAGFKVQSSMVAYWGLPKLHEGSVWLNMSKVHKHHQPVTVEQ
eukprot:symbB.v1.2.004790.t1/scaffold270.1/size246978/1